MTKAEHEIEVTPEMEDEIQTMAAELGLDPEMLRYYVQFGPTAPTPPVPWHTVAFPFWRAAWSAKWKLAFWITVVVWWAWVNLPK